MKYFYKLIFLLTLLALTLTGCGSSEDSAPLLKDGEVVSFTLLQTTDVHHRALGTGASSTYGTDSDATQGGYSRLATEIRRIRAEKEAEGIPTLLVDSGDFLMGTVYDMTLGGTSAAMAFMNLMDYDAVTLGNHEFDYGPGPLASFINNGGNFDNTPIVMSNMVTSDSDRGDDDIEALIKKGRIRDTLLITLPNNLKIGIIGFLGEDAENDAPLAAPVTFDNNLYDPVQIYTLQKKINHLKNSLGANVIIALSHSGITDTGTDSPGGDDMLLARMVSGIDIIASGHEHEQTDTVIIEPTNGTRIICAGHYGKNLAQLDITVTVGEGITEAIPHNNPIDSAIEQDPQVAFMIGLAESGINSALTGAGLPEINQVVASTDSDNVAKPHAANESGMGNLVADSLRFTLAGQETGIGVAANGIIRNGFSIGQPISFADIYSVLPLGMTIDPQQQDIPGYPLLKFYLTGQELVHLSQFISYVMAAQDTGFRNSLPDRQTSYEALSASATELAEALNNPETQEAAYNGMVLPAAGTSPADEAILAYGAFGYAGAAQVYSAAAAQAGQAAALCEGLYYQVLPALDSEYFMNISGAGFTSGGADNLYQIAGVSLYHPLDFLCNGSLPGLDMTQIYDIGAPETFSEELAATYPVVIDLYAFLIMQSDIFDTMLNSLGIPMVPRHQSGEPIFTDSEGNPRLINTASLLDMVTLLQFRVDQDPSAEGIQEVKEWQAFLAFILNDEYGLGYFIPDSAYGSNAIADFISTASRINTVPSAPVK